MTEGLDDRGSPGSWLRQHRQAAGLTQEQLAERAGLSVRTISSLERDRIRRPYPRSVRQMITALGLPEATDGDLIALFRTRRDTGSFPTVPASGDGPAAGWGSSASPTRPPTSGEVEREPTSPASCPRQLPPASRHFVGRRAELASLTRLLDQAAGMPGAVVITAIAGTAGVGKTALAIHWAHRIAGRFPDGQLYVNLRGFDPSAIPVAAAEALGGFLRALGVPGPQIPVDADERAAHYRTLLAGRRMLVVLDNAASVDQVRPLLPGTAGCVALVTSRNALAGLVARDGADRLELDTLPLSDALVLLRTLAGKRVDAEPAAADALVNYCARLPLALRVAAELAAARPTASLASLASELTDERRRLDVLDADGDPHTAVRAVFSWSYQHLDADTARGFRLVGLHPGPDFDRDAVAALTGLTAAQAGALLTALARAHLVHATQPGRYGLHDLLRGYARELSADHDGEPAQKEALTRLFDYYLRAAGTAIDNLSRRRPDRSAGWADGPGAALRWLQTERAVLAAVIAYTAQNGWPRHTIRLASTLHQHLENAGHFLDAIAAHHHARRAAQLTADPLAEADALDNLGRLAWLQGRQPQAIGLLRQALDLFTRSGEPSGQARVQVNLGITAGRQGHYEQAAGHLTEALQLFRRTGNLTGQAQVLNNLGLIELVRGRYEQADVQLRAAYDLATEAGDRPRVLISLNNLGFMEVRRGDCDRARAYLKRALALSVETGDRLIQAHVLASVGEVDLKQRRYRQALDNAQRSRVLCTEIGDRYSQVTALNLVGEILLAMSRPADAQAQHTAALRLAVEIRSMYGQAAAHDGIACSYRAAHDLRQARHHWEQALLRYDELGSPEAGRVRAHLARLDATPSRNGPAPADWRSTFAD